MTAAPAGGGAPLPSITAGPSSAGSDATSSGVAGTGAFNFKSNEKKNAWADALKSSAPFIVLGLVYWMINKK